MTTTTVTFPAPGAFLPQWSHDMVRQSAITLSGTTLDAVDEFLEFIGQVSGPIYTGTKTVSAVIWRTGLSSATGHTIRVSMNDLDYTVGPPARSTNADESYGDVSTPASSTNYRTELSSGTPKSLAYGDWMAVRFRLTAITGGQIGVAAIQGISTSGGYGDLLTTVNTGAGVVSAQYVPTVLIEFTDGSFAIFNIGLPRFSAVNTETYSSATAGTGLGTGNRRAVKWTPDVSYKCNGARVWINTVTSASNFDVAVFQGTTLVTSRSLDANANMQTTGSPRYLQITWPEVTIHSGSTYYLAVIPTTTENITLQSLDVLSGSHLAAFAPSFSYDCWDNASAWQNPANSDKRLLVSSFRVSGVIVSSSLSGSTTTTSTVVTRNSFFL